MKESIINVLALFGAVILVISIWLVMFTLLAEWKEHVKEKKNVEEKEHTKLHIGLKRSHLQSAIVLIAGIVKVLDLQMIRSSQKQLNVICGIETWLHMITVSAIGLILESEKKR